MRIRLSFVPTLFALASLFAIASMAACATGGEPRDPLEEEIAERGPPPCVRQDIGPLNSTVTSCVRNFEPATLPEEMQRRQPYMVTVIETPRGRYGNPLTWSVEVRRDGEIVAEREFGQEDVVDQEGGRVQIRQETPLGDEELEPGTYEFRFLQDDEGEVGTTTIEVEPPEADDDQPEEPIDDETEAPSGVNGSDTPR